MLMTDLCLIQRRGWERRGEERREDSQPSSSFLSLHTFKDSVAWTARLHIVVWVFQFMCHPLCIGQSDYRQKHNAKTKGRPRT